MAVDLATAKQQLNLTTDDDNSLVERLILVAQDWLERQLGYTLADRYTVGSPATLTVPPALDHAVLLMVGHFYANREASLIGGTGGSELPLGVCDIVNDYRDWSWSDGNA
ncbi:head-tail connector protein [Bradyrhizobium sp. CCBAU 25338]|uniref:head-tail connector protein n=1 Tax=Bradyrhizobium sp. CCBAU 25338 TaxID=1641877 RepID=UPI002302E5BD|nr:head-tail connector protein [Bradyrhizobium sp. CCBAU 25338]MDA9530339.1 hypothetical protein [Bradyrhizobium sp. CCBAU 25338]